MSEPLTLQHIKEKVLAIRDTFGQEDGVHVFANSVYNHLHQIYFGMDHVGVLGEISREKKNGLHTLADAFDDAKGCLDDFGYSRRAAKAYLESVQAMFAPQISLLNAERQPVKAVEQGPIFHHPV